MFAMTTGLFQVLYLSSLYVFLLIQHAGSISFNFNFSDSNTVKENIRFEGDAHYGDLYFNHLDRISLTNDAPGTDMHKRSGRASYNQPMALWDEHSGEITNFTTQFSLLIQNITADSVGDGLAFFISPYPSQLPPDGRAAESALGLFNGSSTYTDPSANRIIAVEFDTYLNPDIDPNSNDTTVSHIGIDVNVIYSTSYRLIPRSLFVGVRMTAQIKYNSGPKLLSVLLWHDADPNTNFSINATVDLKKELPPFSAIGFSASTGGGVQLSQILSWSLNSSLNATMWQHKNQHQLSVKVIIAISIGTSCIIVILVLAYCGLKRREYFTKRRKTELVNTQSIDDVIESGRGPTRYSSKDLLVATNKFALENKLGQGGFGSVYKGKLNGVDVAVKKISEGSSQGEKEYISEVDIISKLRHRHLVKLVGWCHERGKFSLVYQLMENGSLNKHLYGDNILNWQARRKIALQLGEAILYLHTGWDQCVVHRDIKPSNIMLDSAFNAKLGDFGLARLIDHNNHSRDWKSTGPAGTFGYIAPEILFHGITYASTYSDVFSFGVVLLEIVCGRKPIDPDQEDKHKANLLQWVWDLYVCDQLMEAVDERLNGDFDREEIERFMIVGLWCAYPDRSSRPSIDEAMSVLRLKVGLPSLPRKNPMPRYDSEVDSNYTHTSSSTGVCLI